MGTCLGCNKSSINVASPKDSFETDKKRSFLISGYVRKCWILQNIQQLFPENNILKLIESYIALNDISDDKENKQDGLAGFDNLKYKNAINILTNWWNENIAILSDGKYLEIAMSFYNNIFIHMPSAKEKFISRKVDMNVQSLKMLGMFRWIILTLNNSSLCNNTLIALRQLGALHDDIGLTLQHYLKAGDVFHETMSKTFPNTYDLRVKWCFNILYEIIVGVMLGNDFNKLCDKQKDKLLSLWKQIDGKNNSLEHCFNDKEIMLYLQLFMKEQFCMELLLFIVDYNKYKLLFVNKNNNNQRNKFGEYMNKLYIENNSKQQINISGVCRNLFYEKLEIENNIYTDNIYDDCYDEIIQLIELSVYPNFKQAIKECIDSIKIEPSISTKKVDFLCITNRSLVYPAQISTMFG